MFVFVAVIGAAGVLENRWITLGVAVLAGIGWHWKPFRAFLAAVALLSLGTRLGECLKAAYAIPASFSPEAQAILAALKTYGMFLADNGSDWFLSGAPDARWNNDRLRAELATVKGRDLEVVKMVGLVTQV